MKFEKITPPTRGDYITVGKDGKLIIPSQPIIPYIEGDGVGPDIWHASQPVFDAAVKKVYGDQRKIIWWEVFAGEKAQSRYQELLPQDTLHAIDQCSIAIKGPLTTPVGGGFRSLNVSLRQIFDLYACMRPVRYFEGVPAPVKHPEAVDMVIFRENTEDVYAGIEWASGSPSAIKLISFLRDELDVVVRDDSGLGIKPISPFGSKRLVSKAMNYAIKHHKPSLTLVHKGNIQKYTEGAFQEWGYALIAQDFAQLSITEREVFAHHGGQTPDGKILIKDRIADAMFQQALLRPREYSVIATTNLNGDYLSDALIAQVGGLGLGPGANLGDRIAIFEATHGSAPKYAGQNKVNPGSVILSGALMLEHLGWPEASHCIVAGLEQAIKAKTVTYDLERQMPGAKLLSCSEFGQAIIDHF